jgi:hypothetical protein
VTPDAATPVTEVEQLKQQNALLLKRLLVVSRQRDELARQLAALRPEAVPGERDRKGDEAA